MRVFIFMGRACFSKTTLDMFLCGCMCNYQYIYTSADSVSKLVVINTLVIISVFWKEVEKEVVGLGFPPTNEPIINKRHALSANSYNHLQTRNWDILSVYVGFYATFCRKYKALFPQKKKLT